MSNYIKKKSTFLSDAKTRFLKNKPATIALFFLLLLLIFSVFIPLLSPYTYYETHLEWKNLPPSCQFWFGTDELGRDLLTRSFWGAKISLLIGIIAAIIDLVIGVLWGSISAFLGGRVDETLMRICDILHAIPYLLMVILLLVIMGPGILTILLALTLTGWINMARIVRGQILILKQMEFVQSAELLGSSSSRIILRHLLPNSIGPILSTMTMTIPIAIYTEAFLSFLGLGIQAPVASLGVMVNDALGALRYYPWRLFFPAAIISSIMLCFHLVGEGIQEALNPKLQIHR